MCIIISPLCLDMFLRPLDDVQIFICLFMANMFSYYCSKILFCWRTMNDEKCIEIPEFGKNDHIDWQLLPSLLPFLPKKFGEWHQFDTISICSIK